MFVSLQNFYVAAICSLKSRIEIDIGDTADDLAVGVLYKGLESLDESGSLCGSVVHFPVARDNGFSELLIHSETSFLPEKSRGFAARGLKICR